ncbi:MAG TPA: alpha/beta hydrolase [Devosiaceae bacterium]|nr:alpha/beta hydrolase [Devosiaceae bacterium]
MLLHEMGGTLESWDRTLPILAQSHQVLAYDWRGAGQSERIQGEVTISDHAGDLLALLDARGLAGRAVIAGCAVGGAIAAAFAAAHRERVAGLVLMSPAMDIPSEVREDRLRNIARFLEGGMREAVDASLAGGYPERFRLDEARFASFRARWLANDPESFAATYRMLLDLQIAPVLAALQCPVLAVGGDHDTVRPPDYVQEVARRIAGARFVRVPGGHHMPHQIPEIVAALIADFAASAAVLEHG